MPFASQSFDALATKALAGLLSKWLGFVVRFKIDATPPVDQMQKADQLLAGVGTDKVASADEFPIELLGLFEASCRNTRCAFPAARENRRSLPGFPGSGSSSKSLILTVTPRFWDRLTFFRVSCGRPSHHSLKLTRWMAATLSHSTG